MQQPPDLLILRLVPFMGRWWPKRFDRRGCVFSTSSAWKKNQHAA